uniref:CSON010200 protein n=1 Tax=Culicoides sonorensis TaxID=179676 RepID=A0A336LLR8_CULSO
MMQSERFPEYQVPGRQVHNFNPYESNGGSVIAIGGKGYAVIAADTRLSTGYSIHTRNQKKLFQLTKTTVLASSGCWPDVLALTSLLKARIQMYLYQHGKEMTTNAIAQLLSNLMYNRRFFPYYVSNVLAGLDSENNGVVYSYDPIGHCEKKTYNAGGSSGALLQPVLDNQVGYKNQNNVEKQPISMERAKSIIKDTFISAAERDIYTGDGILLHVITSDKIETEEVPLRKD